MQYPLNALTLKCNTLKHSRAWAYFPRIRYRMGFARFARIGKSFLISYSKNYFFSPDVCLIKSNTR